MEKYIAFDLYQKNEKGGHQSRLQWAKKTGGREVYLASHVDELLAAIPAYLLDPHDSHYCEPLATAIKSLMESGR